MLCERWRIPHPMIAGNSPILMRPDHRFRFVTRLLTMEKSSKCDRFLFRLFSTLTRRRFVFREMSAASVSVVSTNAVLFKLWYSKAAPISVKLGSGHLMVASRYDQSRFHLALTFSGRLVFPVAFRFNR
jgi:hypothetical protein